MPASESTTRTERDSPAREDRLSIPLVALLFLVLTMVMLYPISLNPATYARDFGDTLYNSWALAWETRTISSDPLNLYHSNIFHPFPYSLAFADALVGDLVIAAPVIWLTGNPLLAHNTALLLSFILSGLGTYLLVRRLTWSHTAGIIAGVAFAFAPYKIAHAGHLNLVTAQWMPFALLLLDGALRAGRWRHFLLFGLCFTLQALSCLYYAFFFVVALALYVAYVATIYRHLITRSKVGRFVTVWAMAALATLPFGLPYFRAQDVYGFQRDLGEVARLSADLRDYLSAPPENLLYGGLTARFANPELPWEHHLFPGVLVVALAAAGGWAALRRPWGGCAGASGQEVCRAEPGAVAARECAAGAGYYVLLTVSAFALSLGPTLRIAGNDTGIPLPYQLLHQFAPGFQALRGLSRIDIVVTLGLSVLAGYGAAWLQRLLARQRVGAVPRAALGPALATALLLEFVSLPIPALPLSTLERWGRDPAVYQWLAGLDEDVVVMELPNSRADQTMNPVYEYFSTYHWHRLVNGYSSFYPPLYWYIVDELEAFPSVAAVDLLRGLGVDLVIVHADLLPRDRWEQIEAALSAHPDLTLVQRFGTDYVYRLTAAGDEPEPVVLAASVPTLVAAGEPFNVIVSLRNPDRSTRLMAPAAELALAARWTGPGQAETRSRVPLPPALRRDELFQFAVQLPAPERVGAYQLELHLEAAGAIHRASAEVEVGGRLPDSLTTEGLGAAIGACQPPRHLSAGAPFAFECEVRNVGRSVWLYRPAEYAGWVGLGIQLWYDQTGAEVIASNGAPLAARGMLPWSLWPGQSAVVRVSGIAPSRPGTYTARLDLVSELVTWFSDAGGVAPREVRIVVE